MDRAEVIVNYRSRIKKGKQTKLDGKEQAFLIQTFINDLKILKTEAEIKNRCQEEIALLEEGYSPESVAKNKLSRYRSAIEEATNEGKLKLTRANSRNYKYEKKQGTEKTGEIGRAHHHFGWIYMCYDNDTYLGFQKTLRSC